MKKQFWLASLFVFFGLFAATAQKLEVPGDVVDAFQKKYRTDFMVYTWRILDGNYIAHFSHEGNNKYCSLTPKGKWLEDGEAFDKEKLPEAVLAAIPQLDITAFIVDSYQARLADERSGFLLIYETEKERHEFWVTEDGKIHRQHTYPIPKIEEDELPKKTDDVDWGDGKW